MKGIVVKTNIKNYAMLKRLKKEIYFNLLSYLEEKKSKPKENLGKNLLKIAELASLKYNFDSELEIIGLQGEIVAKLWEIVIKEKIDLSKIKTENSIYNFLLFSAKRIAISLFRKKKRRESIVKWDSFEAFEQEAISFF